MSSRKKILTIGYGGTITMVIDRDRKMVIPAQNVEQILELLPRLNETADVEFLMLEAKDSANVVPDDWTRIAEFIREKYADYDGFVITHGTNTLAYTASALAIALGPTLGKPVVLTGSQLPLTVYGNDARFNFENAVHTAASAAEEGIGEVMIVFDDVVLRGCRSVKVSESSFRAFASPAFSEIGNITSTGIHFTAAARRADNRINFHPTSLVFNTEVLSLDLTPGQRPEMLHELAVSGKCRGIILKSHGAGSVPTEGRYSFLPFIHEVVHEHKIPVIISTKFLGGNAYKEINDECAVLALEAGAIPGMDLTYVMTEVKLMWILAQGNFSERDVRRQMLTNIVGEMREVPEGLLG
jgi:L-asparaginase